MKVVAINWLYSCFGRKTIGRDPQWFCIGAFSREGFEAQEMLEMMKMPLAFNKDTIRPEDITPFRCPMFGH